VKNCFDIQPNTMQTKELLNQLWLWLNEFCEKYSISDSINNEQSDLIMKGLFGFGMKEIPK